MAATPEFFIAKQTENEASQPKHPPFLFSSESNPNPTPQSDIHSNTAPKSSSLGNNFNSGLSVIGNFFISASKAARQAFSASASTSAENPQSPGLTPEYDYLFKVSLQGDHGIGKSYLLQRFSKGTYSNSFMSPLGAYSEVKTLTLNGSHAKLQIWTASERGPFHSRLVPYNGIEAIIVVFDVTDHKSFENLPQWLHEIRRYDITHTLAATKCDIPEKDWAVNKDEIRAFAEENNLNVFFTSAKDDFNVDELFEYVTDFMIKKEQSKKNEEIIQIAPSHSKRG